MKSHLILKHRERWLQTPLPLNVGYKGYEKWSSTFEGANNVLYVHQLLAIADGADPHEVFDPDVDTHHGNDGNPRLPNTEIPWANWSGNVEVMDHGEHVRRHLGKHDTPSVMNGEVEYDQPDVLRDLA